MVFIRYLILFPMRMILLLICALTIIVVFCVITAVMPVSPLRKSIERRLVQVTKQSKMWFCHLLPTDVP